MAKRRANGEGSIRKRKDGRWEGRYTAGRDPSTGKPIYKNVLGKTQGEVKEKLKQIIEDTKGLDIIRAGEYTLGQWMEVWFEDYAMLKVRPSSHQTYRGYIDHHIKPHIGNIPLAKLTTLDLQRLYRKLLGNGRVERRVFNSDGGAWLQRNMVPGCTYQLDPFHRNRAVRTYVDDPDLQQTILDLLHARKTKEAIAVVEASIESTLDPEEQEKRRKLFSYFNNHKHALVPYYQRRGKKPPLPKEGQQAARCGSMESNIFTIIGNRMKHNRTCWSVAGANNLAALLALHHTGHLRSVLRGWSSNGTAKYQLTVTEPMTAAQANREAEGVYIPPHMIYADQVHPAVRHYLADLTPLSEMNYD